MRWLRPLNRTQTPPLRGLFRSQLVGLLENAEGALRRLARMSDASKHEIDEARAAHADARKAVAGAREVFDVVTAHRAKVCSLPENFDAAVFAKLAVDPQVRNEVARLRPVHFPAAFPDVFLRERPGFDCLIGNPPWEQVVVQEHVWWGMHLPGIRGLPVSKMNAAIESFRIQRPDLETAFDLELDHAEAMRNLLRQTFTRMGPGRTDFYQAFAWRNLELTAEGGQFGLVLPNTATQARGHGAVATRDCRHRRGGGGGGGACPAGSPSRRSSITRDGCSMEYTTLNTVALATASRCSPSSPASTLSSGAFDDIDGRYTVALVSARKRSPRTTPQGWL